ncbi:MAG: GHKL domain-containing protein [bacterium]|nr:MAG: GHKL domain-containing protein [bacterium]
MEKYTYSGFSSLLLFFTCLIVLIHIRSSPAQFNLASDSSYFIEMKPSLDIFRPPVPLQPDGHIDWHKLDSLAYGWTNLTEGTPLPGAREDNYFLCRYRLPLPSWEDAALYIDAYLGSFEIYLNQQKFFTYSTDTTIQNQKYSLVQWQIIPLPAYRTGDYLFFKFYTSNQEILKFSNLIIGSHLSFYREIFIKRELDQIVLGVLFIFTALFALLIAIIRKHTGKAMASFSFAILTFCGGGMLMSGVSIRLLFLNNPVFWYYFNGSAQLFFPVGIFLFYEQTFGAGYRGIFRRLWQGFLILAIVILFLEILNLIAFPNYFQYFIFLFIAATVVSMTRAFKFAVHGHVEARIFSIGFFLFGFLGVRDMLMGLHIISGDKMFWHWGLFVFVLCLLYILERQFSKAQKQLKIYSEELETKSQELEEYSKNLEVKVKARTLDLESKNKELNATMQELKETQQQLIIREKLASLGNLVAGVAHEINNPIGAIHSSSDVVDRSLNKISDILEHCRTREDIDNDPQFNKSFVTIHRNNRIILEGSKRVAHIVKSLKTFARLDEATYQKANIHEGLESTLELLYHEYKNKAEIVKEFGDIPEIYCHPNELNQVFMNILSNAVDAIKEDGIIKVRTYSEKENIVVEISDNGSGIPQEEINRIFDPGFTTKGVGVGTGLGLSISHNIIKKHHGQILVDSEMGKGTVFRIILPQKKKERV